MQQPTMTRLLLAAGVMAICALPISAVPAPAPSVAPPPSGCLDIATALMDCLTYVTNDSTTPQPSKECCAGVANVVKENSGCICKALEEATALGVPINLTRTLALPAACSVDAPKFNCNVTSPPSLPPSPPRPWPGPSPLPRPSPNPLPPPQPSPAPSQPARPSPPQSPSPSPQPSPVTSSPPPPPNAKPSPPSASPSPSTPVTPSPPTTPPVSPVVNPTQPPAAPPGVAPISSDAPLKLTSLVAAAFLLPLLWLFSQI